MLLKTKNVLIICIFFLFSGSNNVPTVTANDLSPMASDLLQGLFGAFNMPGEYEKKYS